MSMGTKTSACRTPSGCGVTATTYPARLAEPWINHSHGSRVAIERPCHGHCPETLFAQLRYYDIQFKSSFQAAPVKAPHRSPPVTTRKPCSGDSRRRRCGVAAETPMRQRSPSSLQRGTGTPSKVAACALLAATAAQRTGTVEARSPMFPIDADRKLLSCGAFRRQCCARQVPAHPLWRHGQLERWELGRAVCNAARSTQADCAGAGGP